MAPLPTNNTGRLVVKYSANGREHSIMFRYAGGGAPGVDFIERVDDFFIAANWVMPTDWTFIEWFYYEEGLNVSVPLSGAPTPFAGGLTPFQSSMPGFVSCIGRGTSGRRARLYLLGAAYSPAAAIGDTGDYRVYGSEESNIAALIFAATQLEVVTIFGDAVFWKDYVNLGFNAYWQRQGRG